MRGPQHRYPVLNLVPTEQPASNRERLEDFRERLKTLDREELEFELIVVSDSLAEIRAQLEDEDTGQTHHGAAWRNAAQRACNRKAAEQRLTFSEKHRRDAADLEARQERARANLENQERLKREADERKQKRMEEADRRNDKLLTAFIQEAKHQLPPETYERIRAAAMLRQVTG